MIWQLHGVFQTTKKAVILYPPIEFTSGETARELSKNGDVAARWAELHRYCWNLEIGGIFLDTDQPVKHP